MFWVFIRSANEYLQHIFSSRNDKNTDTFLVEKSILSRALILFGCLYYHFVFLLLHLALCGPGWKPTFFFFFFFHLRLAKGIVKLVGNTFKFANSIVIFLFFSRTFA